MSPMGYIIILPSRFLARSEFCGAKGSGAPKGNQNALTHGLTTREELAWLKANNKFMRQLARL
jgi:hypothetical protein